MAAPGPALLEDSRFRCYEGPIGFALDVISQWHKELAFILRFLHSMEAMPAYHPTEYALPADNGNDIRFPVTAKYSRGGDSRAVKGPTRAPKEGTSSAQPPRAQTPRTQLPTRDPHAPMRRMERTTAGNPAPEQHAWMLAAKVAAEEDTPRSSASVKGTLTGTPNMQR